MDDGAETLEQSVALVKIAAAAGTTDLVGTPHASPEYRFDPQVVQERLRQVEAATGGILRLYSGCDFHLSYDNIEDALKNPRKYTINQNSYLLVEFSDMLIFRNTQEILTRLPGIAKMSPIITHPERNRLLRKRLDEMAEWCDAGALVQVTGGSLLGRFGNSALEFSRTFAGSTTGPFYCERRTQCGSPSADDGCGVRVAGGELLRNAGKNVVHREPTGGFDGSTGASPFCGTDSEVSQMVSGLALGNHRAAAFRQLVSSKTAVSL